MLSDEETGAANRVIRGGGFRDGARRCRSARRYWFSPAFRSGDLGLRLAIRIRMTNAK